jgi:hypothetical protein
MSTDIADQAKFEFERRRLELEERKQALEESWPKKYGAILFSSLFVFLGTVVTAGVTYKTTHDAQELTKQQRIAADKATMLQTHRERADGIGDVFQEHGHDESGKRRSSREPYAAHSGNFRQ